ncbi:MAG: DsbA family oxidoreductase [Actinobacteria bacterium]|nr:DsbA family oxidoreductase [Actinomycetota bacterium]
MSIDVYSDVVCPWCYIGKRRFEAGMALAEAEDLGVKFEVSYRPFQLDPTAAPGVAGPVVEAYARKFGGMEQAEQILARVTSAAADEGLEFNMDRALRANTLLAHRLLWLADQPDSPVDQEILKERLLKAYFTDGVHIGDPDALTECAVDVGFDRAEIEQFLESDRGVSEVQAELEEARTNGIAAVPTYVLNGQWAIPGAQDPETFAQVLRKMAAKATESE